jgi:hypothetical protein
MLTRYMRGATLELYGLRLQLRGSVSVFSFYPDGPRPCQEGSLSEGSRMRGLTVVYGPRIVRGRNGRCLTVLEWVWQSR